MKTFRFHKYEFHVFLIPPLPRCKNQTLQPNKNRAMEMQNCKSIGNPAIPSFNFICEFPLSDLINEHLENVNLALQHHITVSPSDGINANQICFDMLQLIRCHSCALPPFNSFRCRFRHTRSHSILSWMGNMFKACQIRCVFDGCDFKVALTITVWLHDQAPVV